MKLIRSISLAVCALMVSAAAFGQATTPDYDAAATTAASALQTTLAGVLPIAVGLLAAFIGVGVVFKLIRRGAHGS